MRERGIFTGDDHSGTFPQKGEGFVPTIPVREGRTTLRPHGEWKGLPDNTLFFGRFFIGEERVYGRFTEALTPSGERFPVCLEIWDAEKGGRGVLHDDQGGAGETATILSMANIKAVERFE